MEKKHPVHRRPKQVWIAQKSSRCVEILRLPAPLDILAKGNLSDAVAANLADDSTLTSEMMVA
jgi:DNA-binding winged helix-turn-helix (wHTH) protein